MTKLITVEELAIKKLSGQAYTLTLDVGWDSYIEFADSIQGYLESSENVKLTVDEIAANPRVFEAFTKLVEDSYANHYLEDDIDDAACTAFPSIFKTEIKAAREETARLQAIQRAKEEEERKAELEERKRLEKESGYILKLPTKKSRDQAAAILRAAGLL